MPRTRKIRSAWDEEIEESFYSEENRKEMVDNDELTPLEEAFMMGWEEAEDESDDELED